nr:hypothetical protein [Tanacetum cinerariifolium]
MNVCQKLTDRVMSRGTIVELQNRNTSRVARANVTKLKRLQTADLRKSRILMRVVTKTHNKILDNIEFAARQKPQFPLNYESEPGYIENYNSYPYDSSSFPQQYLCCENCGGPHETFQCQPMNQNFYNSNSFGFDQSQPSQFPVIHQPPHEMSIQEMEDLKQQYLDEMKRLINSEYRDEIKIDELKGNFNSMSIEINKKEKLLQLKQLTNLSTYPSKRFNSFCYDDDDDED